MAQPPGLEFVCAILRRGLDVLIVRPQSVNGQRGQWSFLAGPLAPGEDSEEACHRICLERIGTDIEVQVRQPPLRSRQGDVRVLYHYFFGQPVDETIDNREFAETRWVRLGQLREYEFDETTEVVVQWLLRHA